MINIIAHLIIYFLLIIIVIALKPTIINKFITELFVNIKMILFCYSIYFILDNYYTLNFMYNISLRNTIKTLFINFILYLNIIYLYNRYYSKYNTKDNNKKYNYKIDIYYLKSVIIAPIIEEYLFRFYIYNYLKNNINIYLICLFSTIIFVLCHIPLRLNNIRYNYKSLVFPFIIYTIFGAYFFIIFFKTKNILNSIISHIIANYIGMPLFQRLNHLNKKEKTYYYIILCLSLLFFTYLILYNI